ncbi:PAS domain S-box protein [Hymenobacter sp. B1770]|uniref:PAS domain S-box protein n=1 Tax=Hymenobacter sp. B1770 TaxID=1718788 RepID=UPI003CF4A26C
MHTPSSPSSTDWAAQLAGERARREQAESALAAAQAEVAALKHELAATASNAQRHLTQLTALVQNLRAGLVLVDNDEQIQFVNQHFWQLFGLPPVAGPAEGQPPIPHDAVQISGAFLDPAAFIRRVLALHAAGETVLEEEFLLADGRVVELDYLVLDSQRAGRLICYRDVTERHQRAAQARALSYISQQNPNPVLRLTENGEVVYANPAAATLLQALTAETPEAALPPDIVALVHEALRTQTPLQRELAVAGHHYLSTVVALAGQPFATLYLTNITERQVAEQQLAEQRAFYESVLEQVPSAVSVLDAEHRYLFLNPVVEPDPIVRAWMIGKTNEEACAYRLRPEAVMRNRADKFAEVLREQREVAWEETRVGPDGLQYILLRYRPMRGPNGVLLVICSGVDITERKQAEEKIARQQEFYELILNQLPVDVAIFDAEHRFLFVNPSAVADPEVRRQIIGMTNAEYFEFRQMHQLFEMAQQREQYFNLAVRTQTDVTWEEMRTGRNQRPQLILRNLRPVFNADGSLRLVVGSGIDITARYTAEKLQNEVQLMLQEQQVFIRQILDALPNALYLVDPDNSVSFSNQAFDDLLTHSQHWSEPEATPTVRKELQQVRHLSELVRTTQQAQTQELPFTLATGETLYFQVHKRPLPRADGKLGVLTVATDVTAVKQARQELERREKQYHDLVYYSQALICTHDLNGTVLSVNPAIERLMAMPAAEMLGRSIYDALPPEHHASLQAYLEDQKPLQQQQPRLMTVWTSTGERRYLQYYAYQVMEEGYPPYIVASGYDVTTGVLAQRALQHAKQEAEENAQAKEAFLARMSHEIRTPLNGVLGMATLLQKTGLTEQQREYLNTMQHAGQHLLSLLNDVLDMAKITTQHLQLDRAPFDLAVVMQGAGQTVAALAEEKGLQLIVEPLRTVAPRVVGDAYRLHQVLLNLLSNAIKFTDQGQVRLGADVLRDTPTELALRFWVEDTGIGIAPEQQGHIFEAFAQASTETSRRFGGTGLGLAISQQLVSQMGGVLLLCTEPNEGTTFSFTLTLPRPPATIAEQVLATATPSYEGLRGLRVLLAEDNVVNQWIAVVMLENRGVQVKAVSNGTDALAQLSEAVFDAAILDIKMPGLSGVEVTAAVRASPDEVRANIPIIALTANAFESDRIAYLAADMNACITKPYDEADLFQTLLDLTAARAIPN